MNYLKSIAALLLVVMLVSCGKDDDPVLTVGDITGTWKLTALDYTGKTTTSFGGVNIVSDFVGVGKDMDAEIVFDETAYTSTGSYTVDLKTTTAGFSTTSEIPFSGVLGSGSYTIEGNIFKATSAGVETVEATITESSDKSLVMNVATDVTTNTSAGDVTTVLNVKYVMSR